MESVWASEDGKERGGCVSACGTLRTSFYGHHSTDTRLLKSLFGSVVLQTGILKSLRKPGISLCKEKKTVTSMSSQCSLSILQEMAKITKMAFGIINVTIGPPSRFPQNVATDDDTS